MEKGLEMVRVVVVWIAVFGGRAVVAGPIFISPILCCISESGTFRMHPSRTSCAPVAYSSTGDVSGTYRAGILGSRPWIRMYVARHQKEQELGTVRSST